MQPNLKCLRCGYDLRAHTLTDACPECGLHVAHSEVAVSRHFPSWQSLPRIRAAVHIFAISILVRLAGDYASFVVWPSSLDRSLRIIILRAAYFSSWVLSPLLQALAIIVGCTIILKFPHKSRRRVAVVCILLAALRACYLLFDHFNFLWWNRNVNFWLVILPAFLIAAALPITTVLSWTYLTRVILAHASSWYVFCRILSYAAIVTFCFGQFAESMHIVSWQFIFPYAVSMSHWTDPWWLEPGNLLGQWWYEWGQVPNYVCCFFLFVFTYTFSRRLRIKYFVECGHAKARFGTRKSQSTVTTGASL